MTRCSYTAGGLRRQPGGVGGLTVQTARPRDLGALALAIGVLLILLLVTLAFGAPAIR